MKGCSANNDNAFGGVLFFGAVGAEIKKTAGTNVPAVDDRKKMTR